MKAALVELLGSKKVLMTLVAIMVTIGARYGLQLDPEFCLAILGSFAVLVHAQGQADHGKEAAKIQAANSNVPTTQIAGGDITNPPPTPTPETQEAA